MTALRQPPQDCNESKKNPAAQRLKREKGRSGMTVNDYFEGWQRVREGCDGKDRISFARERRWWLAVLRSNLPKAAKAFDADEIDTKISPDMRAWRKVELCLAMVIHRNMKVDMDPSWSSRQRAQAMQNVRRLRAREADKARQAYPCGPWMFLWRDEVERRSK
jgi:hypothetical protein